MVTDAPIPCLSPREAHLLAVFLAVQFDLFQLAAAEKLSHDELLAFVSSPAVQARLDSLRRFAESAFTLRSIHFRQHAIDALAAACKASTNHIETRRCATALLRGLSLQTSTPRPPRPATADFFNPIRPSSEAASQPQEPAFTPHAIHANAVPSASQPAASPQVRAPDAALHNANACSDSTSDPKFNAQLIALGAANIVDVEPDPAPRAVPSPGFSDRDVARILADAIRICDVRAFLTIAAFQTEPASINGRNAPAFIEELVEVLPNHDLSRVEVLEETAHITDLHAAYTLHLHTPAGPIPLILHLLVIDGCWRLTEVESRPEESG